MTKKLFDLNPDDLAALERVRASMGLRSHVETLRALIRSVDAAASAPRPFSGVPSPGAISIVGAASPRDALSGEPFTPRPAQQKKGR